MDRFAAVGSGSGHGRLARRVRRSLDGPRLAAIALVTVLLSLGPMFGSDLLGFFTPAEIAAEWLRHLAELALIALALLLVHAVAEGALPRHVPLRLPVLCMLMLGASVLLARLLHAHYAGGFATAPPGARVFADALRWGLPAVFMTVVADVQWRARQADSAAAQAELMRARLLQGEAEHRLALLQAQIEPHFLFNVLGNVRRLYRTRPDAGSDAITGLMRYLRGAMPRLRSAAGTLADELEVVGAYLDLFRLRMGDRMTHSIESDRSLDTAGFPPMLLLTLVENAIKHGLEPAGGGHVSVVVRRHRDRLQAEVIDDGAGFGGAPGSGTGVGLANVRRQLAARYGDAGSLVLESNEPRGAIARIVIPIRPAPPVAPDDTSDVDA